METAFIKHGIAPDDAHFEAAQIYRRATGRDPYHILADCPYYPRGEQMAMKDASERRCRREPIQYIFGEWDFMDMTLALGPGVFIPRPDTEIVAGEAIRIARAAVGEEIQALDLCSGSGAIALALKRHAPRTHITAVEKSPEALAYLQKNNQKMNNCVSIRQGDVFTFQDTLAPGSLNLIVCNPPYIAPEEKASLEPELSYEPPEALFAQDHGLAFYKHIAPAYYGALKENGALIFEIGWKQESAVTEICRAAGYREIRVLRDLSENPRCVTACK